MRRHSERSLLHSENRFKVCALCFNKGAYSITDVVLQRIQTYFIENFNLTDDCLPASICAKCRSDLLDISQGKKPTSILPDVFPFDSLLPEVTKNKVTRSNPYPICNCRM